MVGKSPHDLNQVLLSHQKWSIIVTMLLLIILDYFVPQKLMKSLERLLKQIETKKNLEEQYSFLGIKYFVPRILRVAMGW